MDPLFSNISLDSLMKAEELFGSSEPNIRSIMQMVNNVSTSIRDGLAKFNWDIFLHMENEQELEELASDYQRQDELGITYVVAGLVFEPDNDTTAGNSKFRGTTIRIRTNFSAVVDPLQYKAE